LGGKRNWGTAHSYDPLLTDDFFIDQIFIASLRRRSQSLWVPCKRSKAAYRFLKISEVSMKEVLSAHPGIYHRGAPILRCCSGRTGYDQCDYTAIEAWRGLVQPIIRRMLRRPAYP